MIYENIFVCSGFYTYSLFDKAIIDGFIYYNVFLTFVARVQQPPPRFFWGEAKKTDKVLSLEFTEYSCFHSHFKASCVTEAPFSIRTPTGGHPSYPSVLYVDHSHQKECVCSRRRTPPGWSKDESPTARKRNRRLTQAILGAKSVSNLGRWQMLKCTILGREFHCMSSRFTQLQTGKSDHERKVMSGDRLRFIT